MLGFCLFVWLMSVEQKSYQQAELRIAILVKELIRYRILLCEGFLLYENFSCSCTAEFSFASAFDLYLLYVTRMHFSVWICMKCYLIGECRGSEGVFFSPVL